MTPVRLMTTPTPVEAAPRLARALGLGAEDLVLKREDVDGLAGGGNKVRKLQVTLNEALAAGATSVVTTGAAQSNHARLTAAAGAAVGLDVVLVLRGHAPPGPARGNLLLDELLGARVVWAGERDAEQVADAHAKATPSCHRVPYGGSHRASAAAYAEAGRELLAQVPDVRHVVVAVGSGGTMAGLVGGLGAERVLGVDTGAVPDARAAVAALLDPTARVDPATLRLDGGRVGPGYGHLTNEVREVLGLAARSAGVVLDPVYTGRAMAGLRAAVASAEITPGERTVFVHTGGLPGLFGHPQL